MLRYFGSFSRAATWAFKWPSTLPARYLLCLAILSFGAIGTASAAPTATSMTVPANGTYGIGQNLNFTVTFDSPLTVDVTGGAPRIAIALDTGGTVYANYLSGSGTATLTFRFIPTSGQQDLTGIVTATTIDLNGSTMRDAGNADAVVAINAVEPSTAGINIDAIQPSVTSVGVPANATYIAGQNLDFTVNLNKAVTVDTTGGTPYISLTLDTGGVVQASYLSGSGTSSLTFRYVVAPTNLDKTGVALGASLVLNGGTITDSHGNTPILTLNGVASTTGVLVDAVPPVVQSITLVDTNPTYAGSVHFTVTFSEPVTGVDTSDFTLTTTGTTAGTIAAVATADNIVYTVTVTGVSGTGTLRLDLKNSGTGIADVATNAITTGFTTGAAYSVNPVAPVVSPTAVPTLTNWALLALSLLLGTSAFNFRSNQRKST